MSAPSSAPSDVDALLRELKHPHTREIQMLRAAVLAAAPGIKESVKWNAPSFYTTEHFATFHLRAKVGVQIVLHLGAKPRPDSKVRHAIVDPEGLLEWKGPDRATITLRSIEEVRRHESPFRQLIAQWITFVGS